MEIPKIPDSIGSKLFYFYIYIIPNDWELLKKEVSGKYTKLNFILCEDKIKIFECEINQNDIKTMHNMIISKKSKEYNPPIFIKLHKNRYYPYIVSIPIEDFTNKEKRIISFTYKYKLGKLIGFHPFIKNKEPPLYEEIHIKTQRKFFAKFYKFFRQKKFRSL